MFIDLLDEKTQLAEQMKKAEQKRADLAAKYTGLQEENTRLIHLYSCAQV
jgi:hypothetical protein